MADPAYIPIIARRRVPYAEQWAFLDVDWTSSVFKFQVREVKDTTGTPLLDDTGLTSFGLAYAGTATVGTHVTAGRLAGTGEGNIYTLTNPTTGNLYLSGDSLLLSVISIETPPLGTSIPFPAERGDDWNGWYDIVREPAAGPYELVMEGPFTVKAGVTIP